MTENNKNKSTFKKKVLNMLPKFVSGPVSNYVGNDEGEIYPDQMDAMGDEPDAKLWNGAKANNTRRVAGDVLIGHMRVIPPKKGDVFTAPSKTKKEKDKAKANEKTADATKEEKTKVEEIEEVAAVVVTISEGGSYDELFKHISQKSEYGKIVIYDVSPGKILGMIMRTLQGEVVENFVAQEHISQQQKTVLEEFKKNCDECGPEAVCFNFECCSHYGGSKFGNLTERDLHLDLLCYLVKEYGCLCMFSDFSLKALIGEWDASLEARLGPNPFAKVGEFSGTFTLAFNPDQLKQSHSAQLVTVGSLTDANAGKGSCSVSAMGGTILYTVTNEGTRAKDYALEILTVVEMASNAAFTDNKLKEIKNDKDQKLIVCEAASTQGLAGHVMITYPASESSIARYDAEKAKEAAEKAEKEAESAVVAVVAVADTKEEDDGPAKGMILASCGHWMELMKIDVNLERLMGTVENEWGNNTPMYENMNLALNGLSGEALQSEIRSQANMYVQSRAPAKFNKRLVKAKMMKKSN